MNTEQEDLDRWVAKGLITPEQATAILNEDARDEEAELVHRAPKHGAVPESARSSLLLEGVAYVGGAIALTAAITALALYWDELSSPGQLGIPVVLCLTLLLGGIGLSGEAGSAKRIGSALWAAATVLFAVSAGTVAYILDLGDNTALIGTAAATAAFALTLWALRRRELQQILLFTSLAVLIGTFFVLPSSTLDTLWYCLAFWSLGFVWVLQTWARVFRPSWLGYLLGCSTMVITNIVYGFEQSWVSLVWGGLTALAIVVLGVASKHVVVFVIGAIGIAALIAQASVQYLGGSFGALLALFSTGAVLLGGVVVLTQLRRSDVA